MEIALGGGSGALHSVPLAGAITGMKQHPPPSYNFEIYRMAEEQHIHIRTGIRGLSVPEVAFEEVDGEY